MTAKEERIWMCRAEGIPEEEIKAIIEKYYDEETGELKCSE